MRPDRSTPQVIALFRGRWSGACLPREIIIGQLGIPVRTADRALARAVRWGEVAKITGYDGGALYCLGSYARANPDLVKSLEKEPWRSLNSKDKTRAARVLRRWQGRMAQAGAHDLRPKHNCIACGYQPHRGP